MMTSPPPITGRFAPSPTGRLHTGSLVAAVGSWLMARHAGGRWLVRMDDLDAPRQVTGMADDILATLESFGLYWDGEITWQSRNIHAYEQAFQQLTQRGVVYPCGCSRKEIAQAVSAPHPENDCLPYPGTCRSGMRSDAVIRSWRVKTGEQGICFEDLRKGRICQRLDRSCGDFVIRRGDGEFAYQLAAVVDDHLSEVNQVVRGDDLLSSTPRQIHLQHLLGLPQPSYCHLPLVTGPGGAKLSKRDNLVSHDLGNLNGRESELLWGVLRFLGQAPPVELQGASCGELLQWGAEQFEVERILQGGGELMFACI
jgi:glutamyl-Q tRNA(Asp) synthetase